MAQQSAVPNPSQSSQILAWLQAGNTLNPQQALKQFACMRLGARIYDLTMAGHTISARTITVKNRHGKDCRVAEYYMPQAGQGGDV